MLCGYFFSVFNTKLFSSCYNILLLKSEFIAALILIIVYISAVIVLFLFVILMIDIKNYLVASHFFIAFS